MRTYMARLGSFEFGIDTAAFKELQRNSAYRWQAKNRIGRRPAMQNTGREADSISLSGVIYPHWRGGLGQMSALRAMAESGLPVPLVYAFDTTGQYCGEWCITSIDETRTVFMEGGGPRRIEFRVSLKEYGEDEDVTPTPPEVLAVLAAIDADKAIEQAKEVENEVKELTLADQAAAAIGKAVATAKEVADTVEKGVNSVLNSDAMRMAKTSLQYAKQMKANVQQVQKSVKALKSAKSIGDKISALGGLGNAAGTASDTMTAAAKNLGFESSVFNGKSKNSLHAKQINSSVTAFEKMATATSSVKNTANKLKGLL